MVSWWKVIESSSQPEYRSLLARSLRAAVLKTAGP
jgi:hypothetical protein